MNKVELIGRLTVNPELKYTESGKAYTRFTLAVNRRFVKEGQEQTADFINIIAWGKTAEFCDKYFGKGQQIGVSGRIQTRTCDDDQGKKHYVTEVVAEEVDFADGKRTNQQSNTENNKTSEDSFDDFSMANEPLPF